MKYIKTYESLFVDEMPSIDQLQDMLEETDLYLEIEHLLKVTGKNRVFSFIIETYDGKIHDYIFYYQHDLNRKSNYSDVYVDTDAFKIEYGLDMGEFERDYELFENGDLYDFLTSNLPMRYVWFYRYEFRNYPYKNSPLFR